MHTVWDPTFTLSIRMDSDVMKNYDDIADALRQIANRLYVLEGTDVSSGLVKDANGEVVGEWEVLNKE